MGTCSSRLTTATAVLPFDGEETVILGYTPPSGSRVAPAASHTHAEIEGHAVAISGLYYSENILSNNELLNIVAEAKKGNLQSVKDLLCSGVDVNTKGMWGNTPLIAACQYGHVSICEALLRNDSINVNMSNEKGATALLYASVEGLSEICSLILSLGGNCDVDPAVVYNSQIDKSGPYTPFSASIVNGHIEIVQKLIESGMNVNGDVLEPTSKIGSDQILTKPIMLACQYNKGEVVKLLFERGANMGIVDGRGYSVLHHACKTKTSSSSVIPVLLSLNTSQLMDESLINGKTNNGDTALMLACDVGSEPAVLALLLAGARVTTLNNIGWSALHYAVKRKSEAVVEALIAAGANSLAKDMKGVSPLDMANKLRQDSVIKSLLLVKPSVLRSVVDESSTNDNMDTFNVLPMVPSVAAIITRDMLTGGSSAPELNANSLDGTEDLEEHKLSRLEDSSFSDRKLFDQATITPSKDECVRDVSAANGSALPFSTPGALDKYNSSSRSTDAPRKEHAPGVLTSDKVPSSVLQITPVYLFGQ